MSIFRTQKKPALARDIGICRCMNTVQAVTTGQGKITQNR